jgi:hypothetical protein
MSKEVSMFSELEVQSEISQLLDELYGNLERAFPGGVGGRELPAFLGASSKSASASGDRRASAATSCSPSPSQVDRPSCLSTAPSTPSDGQIRGHPTKIRAFRPDLYLRVGKKGRGREVKRGHRGFGSLSLNDDRIGHNLHAPAHGLAGFKRLREG